MTDTNGLLRDAGGARPRDELDGLIERLRSVSCILTPECDEHKTVREAAAALVQLREENARLLSDPMNVGWQRAQDAIKDRAAAVSQWKAAIEWQDCALVMQTERDAWKSKLLAEEVEHDATMAERDALKAERADLIKINNKWAGEWDAMREQVEEMRKVIEAAKAMRDRQEIEVVTDPRVLAFDAAIDAAKEKP